MAIDRITQEISLQVGERFLLLYGVNTKDSFCSNDLILQDIEQALHRYLKDIGYQRIVFYSGNSNRKLYFLDPESRNCALLYSQTPSTSASTNMMTVQPGPLGRKKRFFGKKDPQTTNQSPENLKPTTATSSRSSAMQDRDVLTLLQTFMEDETQLSAIIFPHAEDLRLFELRRELEGTIVNWSRLLPTNKNLCVFIFHQDTYDELQNFCHRFELTYLNKLPANRVSTPTASEISNLIHRFRLQTEAPIIFKWKELDSLSVALAKESRTLKYWHQSFESINEFSLEQAYRTGWTSPPKELPLPTAEELTNQLRQKVIGHQESIASLVKLVRGKLTAQKSPKPLVILLPGPTGTGKTELSKALSEALGMTLERCAMGEYGEEHKVANLFGAPVGYVGAEKGGWLPNALRRNQQRCVLLFDEIEKAHSSIWPKTLEFFDEGRVSDTNGTAIAPKDTICLLTTNLEGEKIAEAPNRAKEILQKTGILPPEFIGRIDKVIPLSRLGLTEQGEMIFRLVKRFAQDRYGIDLVLDSPALAALVQKTYEQAQNYGGRGVNEVITDLFTDRCIELQSQGIVHGELVLEDGRMQIIPSEGEQPTLDFTALADGEGRRDDSTLEALLTELYGMIGLTSVKVAIGEFVASEQAKQRLRQAGFQTEDHTTHHMLFLGNPGTGKTTVARLVGKILKALGVLKKGQFVEASRELLVAEYVGQTAPKTRAKVEEALDGILFIDEAYALASPRGVGNDYGQEVINTLVPMLENYRDRLVVIFAGYTREMQDFLATNPGIQSRIAKTIEFSDYNADEMLEIFLYFCGTNKPAYICPPNVVKTVRDRLYLMYTNRTHNFGNARDVRNLFESMILLQRVRLLRENLQSEAMVTFNASDIPPLH
jgi:SpoVK/Ycf46/Vps4 family AAA+-type ATPase